MMQTISATSRKQFSRMGVYLHQILSEAMSTTRLR